MDRLLHWSAGNMEAAGAQILRKIVIAFPVSLVPAVITEMIVSNDGLGFFIV